MKLETRKLYLMAVLCPLLSLGAATGIVRYEQWHLQRVRLQLKQGESEFNDLSQRLQRATKGQQGHAADEHAHEH